MAVAQTVAAAQNSQSREKWQGNAMHQLLSTKHVYVETERVNIFLNETSIINFFTFKGVITDFLPLVAAQVFIVTGHPDCHMFTVHMTFEHFCPDPKFCKGRGGGRQAIFEPHYPLAGIGEAKPHPPIPAHPCSLSPHE